MNLFAATIALNCKSKEEITNYLKLLTKYQIKLILVKLINTKEFWEKLAILENFTKAYQMVVYGEISGQLLEELNLTDKKPKELITFFQNKGLAGVKIAEDIDLSWQAKLTNNSSQFKVIINGSYNILQLEQLVLEHRINNDNTISCYNFYPQRYTGASIDFYLINQYESHFNNIPFAGYVSSQEESKPSLELHRDWDLLAQIHHLIALGTDIIIFANQLAEKDLMLLNNLDWEQVPLAVTVESDISEIEKSILFDEKIHFVRPDLAQDLIRSTKSQKNNLKILARKSNDYFEIGDIVILNQDASSGTGELQIITKKIKNDGIRNLVAKIKEPYYSYFLSELKATRPFKFVN